MRVGILIISDRSFRGERPDASGPALREAVAVLSPQEVKLDLVPDEREMIATRLREWVREGLDLILTSGGTGLGPRDVTPEATREVIDREAPGFAEAMREETRKKTPHAILSRAVSGIADRTLIINLPGNPRGARECLEVILPALPHALEVLRGEAGE
jgi:molybdenum cofactor synthesis domain-containing protein